jgi:hypothetical protein
VRFTFFRLFSRIGACFFSLFVLVVSGISVAFGEPADVLRAESYELDVLSGRADGPPQVIGLWATGKYQDTPYRVQIPARFMEVGRLSVVYKWSAGSPWAGTSEKVELHWRKQGGTWQSVVLGEGFRDPVSGHLLLFASHLDIGDNYVGILELKFVLRLQNGEIIQDGGAQAPIQLRVVPRPSNNRLFFRSDWRNSLTGSLSPGEVFEIYYDCHRLVHQMNLRRDEPTPWSIVAHVRFDEQPVEEYPLVVSLGGGSSQVLSFIPTVAIPESARQMSVWFLAFYNSRSYFDSNFGLNFNFDLLTHYAIPFIELARQAPTWSPVCGNS